MTKTWLGDLFKKARQEKNISQKKLGSKLGFTSGQFIYSYESGSVYPPLKKIKKIARILDLDIETVRSACIADTVNHVTEKLK